MSERSGDSVAVPTPHPWRRSQVTAVATLGALLAAIVGMASGSSPWGNGRGEAGSTVPAAVGNVLVVVLAAGLCLLVGLAWIDTPRRRTVKRRREEGLVLDELGTSLKTGARVLFSGLVAVLALIAAFAVLLGRVSTPGRPDAGAGRAPGGGIGVPGSPDGGASSASPTFHWFVIGLVVSFAVIAPLGLLVRRRRREAEPDPGLPAADEPLARAVGDSIDQIERDPDARRSIIRAYARMEQAFDVAGAPRRPHETPFEFVGRALRGLQVSPSAAERLASLFERARFGGQIAGPEAKNEALAALREIQRQLEPPA